MRRTAVLIPLAALLLAGCGGGDDEPAVLSVTTPAPSATAGTPAAPATPTGSAPAPAPTTAPGATTGPGPTAAPVGPAAAYQVLAIDWQRARGVFFTAISENQRRPVAQQRALAATYLRAQRAFADGLTRTGWPAGARPAVRALLAVNKRQEANIAAMASAPSSGAFTTALGRYGTLAGPENAAVTAVAKALA
ncbi:MAG TPA: hypothetical protein VI357_03485 [Mycobacteriales bacterium]